MNVVCFSVRLFSFLKFFSLIECSSFFQLFFSICSLFFFLKNLFCCLDHFFRQCEKNNRREEPRERARRIDPKGRRHGTARVCESGLCCGVVVVHLLSPTQDCGNCLYRRYVLLRRQLELKAQMDAVRQQSTNVMNAAVAGITEAVRTRGQSVSKPRQDVRVGKQEPHILGQDFDDLEFTFNGYTKPC